MLKKDNYEFYCQSCGVLLFRYSFEKDENSSCINLLLDVKCRPHGCNLFSKVVVPLELEKV